MLSETLFQAEHTRSGYLKRLRQLSGVTPTSCRSQLQLIGNWTNPTNLGRFGFQSGYLQRNTQTPVNILFIIIKNLYLKSTAPTCLTDLYYSSSQAADRLWRKSRIDSVKTLRRFLRMWWSYRIPKKRLQHLFIHLKTTDCQTAARGHCRSITRGKASSDFDTNTLLLLFPTSTNVFVNALKMKTGLLLIS